MTTTVVTFDLSEIFSNAWSIFRNTGHSFSNALRAAWAQAKQAVKRLAISAEKIAELSIQELEDLKHAIEATLQAKKDIHSPEKKFAHKLKTEERDGKVYTTSHYNSDFVAAARGLRGSFLSGQWVFDANVREHVIGAMEQHYGVTGLQPYEVCTIVVNEMDAWEYTSGVELFGRPIAKGYGRDSGARPAEDIFLISGKFTTGGSVKNWKTILEGATFEMHNFPVDALKRADVQEWISKGWASVK